MIQSKKISLVLSSEVAHQVALQKQYGDSKCVCNHLRRPQMHTDILIWHLCGRLKTQCVIFILI